MKLIILPLSVLILLSIVSMLGLGRTTLGTMDFTGFVNEQGVMVNYDTLYYDRTGHPVCYANLTLYDPNENGYLFEQDYSYMLAYKNASSPQGYNLYYDTAASKPIKYSAAITDQIGGAKQPAATTAGLKFDSWNSLGLIIGLSALLIVVCIAGARFLSYGQSEIGVDAIFKTTGYVGIWGVFSVLALPLMFQTPLNIMYFILTVIFTLGVINSVGHPSDE